MKNRLIPVVMKAVLGVTLCIICFAAGRLDVNALTLEFDSDTQEIIVAGVPETNAQYNYSVNGHLYFGDERIESFCYGTAAIWYDIPNAQAYIFSYSDKEFLLPCSGTYVMTAWIETRDAVTWEDLGKSDKTSISFYYQKKDESTNWGPGLPETMVEDWEIIDLKGKDKNMVVSGGTEPYLYTWTINGTDIYNDPGEGEHVNLEILSMDARFDGYIPGNEITSIKLDIAHSGDFGFTAQLDYTLGAEHAGRYANLFYILEPGKYEFVQSCLIGANGVATFSLNHASSYFVVIREDAYTGEAVVVPAPEPEPVPVPEAEPEIMPETTVESNAQTDGETGENEDEAISETESVSDAEENGKAEESISGSDNDSSGIGWIVGIAAAILAFAGVLMMCLVKKSKRK